MKNILIRKMKSLRNIICMFFVMVVGAVFVSSCSDDLLEKTPLYAISEDVVFNDPVFLSGYIANAYNGIKPQHKPEAGGFIGLTDLAFIQTQTNAIGSAGGEYLQGGMTPENVDALTANLWEHQYGFITKVNVFFENVEGSEIDPDVLNPMLNRTPTVKGLNAG